jgi:hypothetical protein
MSNDPRWRVAVHEAGHVAAALRVGCCPTQAGLDSEGGGFTRFTEPHHPAAGLFIASAGRAAEEMVCGPSPDASRTHHNDREMATQYAARCAPNATDAGLRMMASARMATARFVHDNAPVIHAIAAAIMQRGIIDGQTISAIAEQYRAGNLDAVMPYRGNGVPAYSQDINGRPMTM